MSVNSATTSSRSVAAKDQNPPRRAPLPWVPFEHLGPRSTRNPNLTGAHDHELTGRQLVRVFLQRLIQVFDFGFQLGPGEPEEQNAGVSKALVEDQLTEIAVRNDEDPLLSDGDCQDILIR